MNDLLAIESLITQATGVSGLQLRSKRRSAPYVEARRLFSQMAHELGYSFSEIGRHLGKDHTTIMHHVKGKNV